MFDGNIVFDRSGWQWLLRYLFVLPALGGRKDGSGASSHHGGAPPQPFPPETETYNYTECLFLK